MKLQSSNYKFKKMNTKTKGGVTAKTTHGLSMQAKYEHGHNWQEEIVSLFDRNGFKKNFFPINDGLGKRKADYQYDGVWIEAKTYIGDSDVTKILRLKPFLDTEDINMVVMCDFAENDTVGKKHKKVITQLRNNGVEVYCGYEECLTYISLEKATKNIMNKIPGMATGMNIPLRLLYPNPFNRDLVAHNGPAINKSILNFGFFTQLNVVPHIINEDGEQTYMLFEGHNRLNQLLELQSNGYKIQDVACTVVDWVTSDQIEVLHKMLITTNTTSKNWKMRDYVKSNLAYFRKLNMVEAIETFEYIEYWMKQAKDNGWGESTPCYVFCHDETKDFGDIETIKNGSYRIDKKKYEKEVLPLFKLIQNVIEETEESINGSFVKELLVDIRVRRYNDTKFASKFKVYMDFLHNFLLGMLAGGKELPSNKTDIIKKIQELNTKFNNKRVMVKKK